MIGRLYPLMFIVPHNPQSQVDTACSVVVKIAQYDLTSYNSNWMGDSELGDFCLVPDVDICVEKHFFATELEAQRFIQKWWRKQELGD